MRNEYCEKDGDETPRPKTCTSQERQPHKQLPIHALLPSEVKSLSDQKIRTCTNPDLTLSLFLKELSMPPSGNVPRLPSISSMLERKKDADPFRRAIPWSVAVQTKAFDKVERLHQTEHVVLGKRKRTQSKEDIINSTAHAKRMTMRP